MNLQITKYLNQNDYLEIYFERKNYQKLAIRLCPFTLHEVLMHIEATVIGRRATFTQNVYQQLYNCVTLKFAIS